MERLQMKVLFIVILLALPPLIPPSLLQEACPELSQNEASPLQRTL